MVLEFDPYSVLGVPRDATGAQIAKARRRLSREYHPDVNSDPAAASRFVEIQRAFELLSDPATRAEYDRTGRLPGQEPAARGQEAAPGIFVEPASVDFGVLTLGQSGAGAEITVSWTGAPPARIKSGPGNDWWTNLQAVMPDASRVVFSLRAQAVAGTANGMQRDQFTVTLDGTTVTVGLMAEIRDVPPPPPPPVFETARPVAAPRRPAPARHRGKTGPAILGLVTLSFTLIWALLVNQGGGNPGVPSAPTAPAVKPVKVPQARAAALGVQPVFHGVATDADLIGEMVGAPVQRGFEILLPLYSSPGAADFYCIDVTVPGTDPGPAAGLTFIESPIRPVIVRGAKESAYPAALPGTYTLDTGCNRNYSTSFPVTLGSVTVPDLGVTTGSNFDNGMVVFDAHTSGDVTSVTYGAFGNDDSDTLNPPADAACIDGFDTDGEETYWQPVQELVSQQVNGNKGWFGTGTLVFRGSRGQTPEGRFHYSCAQDTSGAPLGIMVP